jgi:hypothetical protein
MALDPKYITDGPLEEAFLNKDSGLPLAGGTITFYRDSSRITPKPVYQLTGSPPNYQYVPLPNPLTLSAIGTVQNSGGDNEVIYYYPWLDDGLTPDLYYVVVRDSNGVEQLTREAWPNAAVSGGGSGTDSLPVQNQISNPQFTEIFINDVPTLTPSTTTYTVSGSELEFDCAPNWTFIINGTGNVVVERLALTGSLAAQTNPPYALKVSVDNGISSCYLRQRFSSNSGLWTSTASNALFLSLGILVKNIINADTEIRMFYQASNGSQATTPLELMAKEIPQLSDYTYYTASSPQIPVSTDTFSGEDGYVDIYISFEPGSLVAISSVQVVPAVNVGSAPILPYDIASANRAEALMGDYYIPRLNSSPTSSLLVGWDFPLNPAQLGDAQTANTTCDYKWDQTICFTSSSTASITRNSSTGGISLNPAAANQSMYLLQYLSASEVKELIYTRLSSNISAWLGSGGGQVSIFVNLYRAPTATAIPILPSRLVDLSSTGELSNIAAGWTEIPRSGLGRARSALSTDSPTVDNDIQFTGWEIVDSGQIADTDKFAIVVTVAWTDITEININSISLNKGDLPARPAALTKSDVLSQCQYYYEKSYNAGVNPGANTLSGVMSFQLFAEPAGGANSYILARTFSFRYNTPKRVTPGLAIYSPSGAASNLLVREYYQGSQLNTANFVVLDWWELFSNGHKGVTLRAVATTFMFQQIGGGWDGTSEAIAFLHYVADCRLGKIA